MIAWRDGDESWSPFFADAPIWFSSRELAALDGGTYETDGTEALAQLRAAGAVRGWDGDRFDVAAGVSLEHTGGHSPGHAVVRVEDGDERAVMIGHLAVSPLHLVTGECPGLHDDHAQAWRVLTALRDEGSLLIGPLWPAPGAGHYAGDTFVALT
jgi:glyoxylase-like metal-dependent hydrolase (beta-lactamase superfamily II)